VRKPERPSLLERLDGLVVSCLPVQRLAECAQGSPTKLGQSIAFGLLDDVAGLSLGVSR
jgi:hypothetical protein